ncbi:hypothetical protein K0M31_015332, partial [Melipona bicolor]
MSKRNQKILSKNLTKKIMTDLLLIFLNVAADVKEDDRKEDLQRLNFGVLVSFFQSK